MAADRISYKADVLSAQLLQANAGVVGEPNWPPAPAAPTAADCFAAHSDLDNSNVQIASLEAQLAVARQLRQTRIDAGRAIMQKVDSVTDALYTPSGAQKNNFGLTPKGAAGPPPPPPAQIVILKIKDGPSPATIFVDWAAQDGAASYEIEWFTSSALTPATRVGNATTTQSEFTTGTLTQGTQYWFRVRAVRANDHGPWSDPATRVAGV